MFLIAAVSVPPTDRVSLATALVRAREACGLSLKHVACLMGVTPQTLQEIERGERAPRLERIYLLRRDPDGQRYVAAFTQAWADLCGVEHTDGLVAEVKRLYGLVATRMAKASLRETTAEREIA